MIKVIGKILGLGLLGGGILGHFLKVNKVDFGYINFILVDIVHSILLPIGRLSFYTASILLYIPKIIKSIGVF